LRKVRRIIHRMVRFAIALVVLLVPPQEASEAERRAFVEKHVDKAVEKGLRELRGLQKPAGFFESTKYGKSNYGATALALYTLLATGVAIEDPAAAKAFDWLLANPFTGDETSRNDTYEISLIAVALSYSVPRLATGPRRDRAVAMLQGAADWLVGAQAPGGGWGYKSKSDGWHDHSNSQFAVLGLRAAANAGARVKKGVWDRELTHYKSSQLADGGWGYRACYMRKGASTATMTAAGVMGLAMALASAGATGPDRISSDPAIRKGLSAMQVHWNRGLTNELKPLGGVPYLLYSVERACMVTGQQLLVNIDWYVEGSWLLLREATQDGLLGSGRDRLASHCFSLLFLKRAFVPVATPTSSNPGEPVKSGGSDANADRPREME